MLVIAGTGHRPVRYIDGWKGLDRSQPLLEDLILDYLSHLKPDVVISGGCTGWDSALAQAALIQRCKLHLYIPYYNYGENWAAPQQTLLQHFKNTATTVRYITAETLSDYGEIAQANIRRDHAMVDDSALMLSLFDGKKNGGTYKTIRYAESEGKPICNFWGLYETLYTVRYNA